MLTVRMKENVHQQEGVFNF